MRVVIIGAGAVGLGTAALLAQNGHSVSVWSPGLVELAGPRQIEAMGAVAGRNDIQVARSLAVDADVAVVAVPGWAHRAVFGALADVLQPGQAVVIQSHMSLGGLLLRRSLDARGRGGVPVVAWGTTVVTGRRTGPLACTVSNVRAQVDLAAVPASASPAGLALCQALFGDRFVARDGLLAVQLSNVNAQNHLAMALCNITRIERGEKWGNYWGITPAVGRLMEALDTERLGIAARLGVAVRTVREHFHLSFDVPLGPVAEQAAAVDTRGNAPLGPTSLDTRYVLEDVPYGLVATEFLGRACAVPTPLHTAGIEMFGALYGRDFRAGNDLLPAMGLGGADAAGLVAAVA